MCLIAATKTGRVTEDAIRNAQRIHSDGIGIAWREGEMVKYKKGITVDETIEMAKTLPLGYVIHFRMASVGGPDESLIHPFPIRKDVPLQKEGESKEVLFHNGHWSDWNQILTNHLSSRLVLPRGRWSDTRALAFLVSIHGKNILNILGRAGRFIVMTEKQNHAFGDFVEDAGVLYSNETYKNYRATTGSCGTGVNSAGTAAWDRSMTRTTRVATGPSSRVSTVQEERETLTEEEYKELKDYYNKELGTTLAK